MWHMPFGDLNPVGCAVSRMVDARWVSCMLNGETRKRSQGVGMIRVPILVGLIGMSLLCYGEDRQLPAQTKARYELLPANVAIELAIHNIPPSTLSVKRVTEDHMVFVLRDGAIDSFQGAIGAEPGLWKKDPRWAVLMYHHRIFAMNSWRTLSSPSFHVTKVARDSYAVDIDEHVPALRRPVESVRHLGEILAHLFSRRSTDQRHIHDLLVREQIVWRASR